MAACRPTRVVLVDDEGSFRESLADMLRGDGHEVLPFEAPSALPDLARLAGVDLLVTDFEMPGTNGIELADAFHRVHPGVPVLLVTAYRTGLEQEVARRPFIRLVQKPVPYDAIHRAIHARDV